MYVQVLRALSEVFELCSKLLSLVVKSDSSNFSSSDVALLDRISKVSDLIVSSKYVWMHPSPTNITGDTLGELER